MKVIVRWCNKNPFVPRIEDLFRVSSADLPNDMDFNIIERYAKDATPERYFLKEIEFLDYKVEYNYTGESKRVEKEK